MNEKWLVTVHTFMGDMRSHYDFTLEGAQVYGVNSFPTTFFIDSAGYVIAKAVGALQASELERGIQMILD